MPDQRSVMKEYRYLDEKRLAGGLTPDEESRFARLRDLVRPDPKPGAPRQGFDVNAAAARLRDSLVPAGLRNRPPPTPSAEPALEAEAAANALASVYAEEPPDAVDAAAAAAPQDAFFEPASLNEAYDPNVQGYDPNAQAYDPNAQAYDPNAQAYDPNAQAYDPNAQAYDPNAQAYDPNAQAYDPNAQAYDPNAQAYDPNAQAYDPNAQAYDPNAQAYDPNTQAYDPNAQAYDPSAQAYDPNAQAYDPTAQAYDPNAQAYDPNPQAYDPNAQTYEPTAQVIDPNAQAYEPTAQVFDPSADGLDPQRLAGLDPQPGEDLAAAWDVTAGQDASDPGSEAAPRTVAEPGIDADPTAAGAADALEPGAAAFPSGEPWQADAAALPPAGWDVAPPAPAPAAGAPLGEYDEADGAPLLPGEDAPVVPPSSEPETPAEPSASDGAPLPLGEYDDTAGFDQAPSTFVEPAGRAGEVPDRDEAAPSGEIGFETGVVLAREGREGWQPDAALEDGFRLESGGSFESAAAGAATSGFAADPAPLPWDAPPLDLGPAPDQALAGDDGGSVAAAAAPEPEPFPSPAAELDGTSEVPDALCLDFDVDAAEEELAVAEPTTALALPPQELSAEEAELPTVEGEDILEEIPSDAPPPPLDFEPLAFDPPAPDAPGATARSDEGGDVPAAMGVPAAPASCHVAGTHRVVVHTVEGLVRRGVLADATLDAPSLSLCPQAGAPAEPVETEKVKAIFFMLAPGETAPAAEGKKVRVTFRDGRQVAGFSPDYDETGIGFFMIPGDARTNTGRIWVYRSAVRQVAVS